VFGPCFSSWPWDEVLHQLLPYPLPMDEVNEKDEFRSPKKAVLRIWAERFRCRHLDTFTSHLSISSFAVLSWNL
jgi:hypothetical protein